MQEVAGHLLMFFGDPGVRFPRFPFVAHSRGWSAEDMENKFRTVEQSAELREGAEELVDRAVPGARRII